MVPGTWKRRPEVLDVAEDRQQEEAGERRSDQLDDDVAGQAFPREVAAQGEGEGDSRIQVRAGNVRP